MYSLQGKLSFYICMAITVKCIISEDAMRRYTYGDVIINCNKKSNDLCFIIFGCGRSFYQLLAIYVFGIVLHMSNKPWHLHRD